MARRSAEYINSGLYAAMTVREGKSGRQGLREFRQAGGHIADKRWFELVSAFRSESQHRTLNLASSVDIIPSEVRQTQWRNSSKRGFFQQVDVVVKDTVTGEVRVRSFTGFGRVLRKIKDVISEAINTFTGGTESGSFNETILGAAYTGTYSVGGIE